MEQLSAPARRLAAAPRHLHRRLLHDDIPDTLLVPDADPVPVSRQDSEPAASSTPVTIQSPSSSRALRAATPVGKHDAEAAYRRKRLAAMIAVVLVVVSVPALVAALLLLG